MAGPVQGTPAPPPPSPPGCSAGPAMPKAMHTPQQPAALHVSQQLAALQAPQLTVHLNWSHFKPEFSGEPDEDTEAHLLCINEWMNAHHFVEGVKVQRFCLTLLGEARLWLQSFIRTY